MALDAAGNWYPDTLPPTPNGPPFIYPSAPSSINYPGPPNDVPPKFQSVVVDINMVQWMFNQNTQSWQ